VAIGATPSAGTCSGAATAPADVDLRLTMDATTAVAVFDRPAVLPSQEKAGAPPLVAPDGGIIWPPAATRELCRRKEPGGALRDGLETAGATAAASRRLYRPPPPRRRRQRRWRFPQYLSWPRPGRGERAEAATKARSERGRRRSSVNAPRSPRGAIPLNQCETAGHARRLRSADVFACLCAL